MVVSTEEISLNHRCQVCFRTAASSYTDPEVSRTYFCKKRNWHSESMGSSNSSEEEECIFSHCRALVQCLWDPVMGGWMRKHPHITSFKCTAIKVLPSVSLRNECTWLCKYPVPSSNLWLITNQLIQAAHQQRKEQCDVWRNIQTLHQLHSCFQLQNCWHVWSFTQQPLGILQTQLVRKTLAPSAPQGIIYRSTMPQLSRSEFTEIFQTEWHVIELNLNGATEIGGVKRPFWHLIIFKALRRLPAHSVSLCAIISELGKASGSSILWGIITGQLAVYLL